jgi:hypothetical protein
MQPTPAPSPPSTSAGNPPAFASTSSTSSSPTSKPVLFLRTHIHPVSRVLAGKLFDVIDDQDPRFSNWYDYADAAVLRIGRITPEEARKAKKLKIIARNGCVVSFHRCFPPFLLFLQGEKLTLRCLQSWIRSGTSRSLSGTRDHGDEPARIERQGCSSSFLLFPFLFLLVDLFSHIHRSPKLPSAMPSPSAVA